MLLEKAKSATLVVLFAICAYLAGLFLLDSNSISAKAVPMTTVSSVNIEELMNPQGYHVSFGGGLYSGTFDMQYMIRLWDVARGLIYVAFEAPSYSEIDQVEWDRYNTVRGITFDLPFPMTTDQILASSGASFTREAFGQETFDTIIIPTGESGVVVLGNRNELRFVKFTLKGNETEMAEILSAIEMDSKTIEYKRLEDIFSLRKILGTTDTVYRENNIIEPIVSLPAMDRFRVANEFNLQTLSEEQERRFADIAFGSRFDFVKRVREVDGSIVYLYGYGDRALRFSSTGSLEYQERYTESATTNYSPTFREGLKKAVEELKKYGALPSEFYLQSYTEAEAVTGQKVKQYYFGYKLNNVPVYLNPQDNGYAALVELTNNQVTHMKKNYKIVQKSILSVETTRKILGVDDLIDINLELILKDYLITNPIASAEKDSFGFVYKIVHDISAFEKIYVLQKENTGFYYQPAWRLTIDQRSYYFNLYTGKLLLDAPIQGVK